MFKVGELIKRKNISHRSGAYCIVVKREEDNYTVYNNSLKCLQMVACVVVDSLYTR